ncbi:MAG: hypothetical protein ABIQ89_03990 [Candidatus Saccharimonadales bacterium]
MGYAFPEKRPAIDYPDVDWDAAGSEIGAKYNGMQSAELLGIALEPAALADADLFEHDISSDPLGQGSSDGEHFNHRQAVAGELEQVVAHKVSGRKLIAGALLVISGILLTSDGLVSAAEEPVRTNDACAEIVSQSPVFNPTDALIKLSDCRQKQVLDR